MSAFQRRTKQTCLVLSSALVFFFVILSLTPAFLDLDSHEPFVLINEKLQPGLNFLGGKQRAMDKTTSPEPDPFRARGFTVLDRLYMKNGTFFVVTGDSSRFPPREHIISRPVDVGVGNDIAPTDKVSYFGYICVCAHHLRPTHTRNCNLSLQRRLVKCLVNTRSQSTVYRLYLPITDNLSTYVSLLTRYILSQI